MASSFSEPLWAEIRKEFGEHYKRRRDYKKANENFEASLQLQPNKLESVYRLANSQAREANLNDALKLLSEKSELGEKLIRKLKKLFNF
jgi:tetratricopeptide (TPR) repeat protein